MLRWCAAVALAALVGCGSSSTERGCTGDVEGTDGVRLSYTAPAADVKAIADTLCRRIEGLGNERPAVAVEGDRIVVVVPEGTPAGVIDFLGVPGRLALYDWEPVLVDEKCRTDPNRNALERSPVAGRERAEGIARRCDAQLVRIERLTPEASLPDVWWAIRGEPVIDGGDVVDPVQMTDPHSNEPLVAMEFTEAAQEKFAAVTRAVARRGADNALPGVPSVQGAHHFAIVLDDQLLSTPLIDYAQHPDGFGGEQGVQIAGGFTKESARVLARLLDLGPLPADLVLVERRTQGG